MIIIITQMLSTSLQDDVIRSLFRLISSLSRTFGGKFMQDGGIIYTLRGRYDGGIIYARWRWK